MNKNELNQRLNLLYLNDCNDPINYSNCMIIHSTPSLRYLGVIFDEHLKWNEHILYIFH